MKKSLSPFGLTAIFETDMVMPGRFCFPFDLIFRFGAPSSSESERGLSSPEDDIIW